MHPTIPSKVWGTQTQQFADSAGLTTDTQKLVCVECVRSGNLNIPQTVALLGGTSLCTDHLQCGILLGMTWYFILLINVLAVHRLTKLVIEDKITEQLRNKLFDKWPPQTSWTYLITCPWCISIWFAGLAVAGLFLFWGVWFIASLILAISSAVGIISTLEDRIQ